MPKRPCPFDSNLLPQFKIHVEEKHVNNGVCKDERMASVYNKTLNLLQEGSRAFSQKMNILGYLDTFEVSQKKDSILVQSAPRFKQMTLNNKLGLGAANKTKDNLKIDVCASCCLIDSSVKNKCYYCDQILCSYCSMQCKKCSETFCQNCCLPMYEEQDYTICLSCYK